MSRESKPADDLCGHCRGVRFVVGRCPACSLDENPLTVITQAWREQMERAVNVERERDDARTQLVAMHLALRNVRALAHRMRRRGDAESAAHLLRFCSEAGVQDEFLRAEGPEDL